MTTIETLRDCTYPASYEALQDDQNFPPIAEAITNKRRHAQASRAASARNTSGRRRFIDPTTCDKDYTEAEMEFMQAMQFYKQASGRSFPTWSEVLEVLKSLGYEKAGSEMAQT